jgi:hypothetical protein
MLATSARQNTTDLPTCCVLDDTSLHLLPHDMRTRYAVEEGRETIRESA